MKPYKELAEMMEKKIDEAIRNTTTIFHFCGLVDCWIAFSERDKETPDNEKAEKYKKVIAYIEDRLEQAEPQEESSGGCINLTFGYIALRQKLEEPADGEREAGMLQLIP